MRPRSPVFPKILLRGRAVVPIAWGRWSPITSTSLEQARVFPLRDAATTVLVQPVAFVCFVSQAGNSCPAASKQKTHSPRHAAACREIFGSEHHSLPTLQAWHHDSESAMESPPSTMTMAGKARSGSFPPYRTQRHLPTGIAHAGG